MPEKIHVIYVLSPQISYDTKEQARTFDTLVLFVPYNEPYLAGLDSVICNYAKALILKNVAENANECVIGKFSFCTSMRPQNGGELVIAYMH